jgi:hypothetical protein
LALSPHGRIQDEFEESEDASNTNSFVGNVDAGPFRLKRSYKRHQRYASQRRWKPNTADDTGRCMLASPAFLMRILIGAVLVLIKVL